MSLPEVFLKFLLENEIDPHLYLQSDYGKFFM